MDLSIPASTLKDFSAALRCLQRFSDDVQVQANHDCLKLSAVSPTRSAFALTAFDSTFFEIYRLSKEDGDAPVQFEVSLKTLVKIFGGKQDSRIDQCDITILDPSRSELSACSSEHQHRLVIRLRLSAGVLKTFSLQYSSSAMLVPLASRDECSSSWVCAPAVIKQWMDHFRGGGGQSTGMKAMEQISFWFRKNGMIQINSIESRDDGSEVIVPKNNDIFSKGISQMTTQLTVSSAEFDEYSISPDSEPLLTFSLKELRAIIDIAQSFSAPLDAAFSTGGKPFLISLHSEGITCDFVLATTADDPARMRTGSEKEEKPKASATPMQRVASGAGHSRNGSMPPPPAPAGQGKGKGSLGDPGLGPNPRPAVRVPLFRRPDEDDEFDDSMEMDVAEFDRAEAEAIQYSQLRASQQLPPLGSSQPQLCLPGDAGVAGGGKETGTSRKKQIPDGVPRRQEHDDSTTEEEDEDEDPQLMETQRDPKRGRWEIMRGD